jgi:NADH-quinone oxidoreductase subunit J
MLLSVVYSLLFLAATVSALFVVFSRHAVYSALYLVVMMIAIAGIFILIDAQLAAFLQIIVYAGAIMVLFLFVIMLLNLGPSPPLPARMRWVRRIGACLVALLVIQLALLVVRYADVIAFQPGERSTASIGEVALSLLTRYLYAFEMTSVLILVAVIGAMVLARKSVVSEARDSPRTPRVSPNRPQEKPPAR